MASRHNQEEARAVMVWLPSPTLAEFQLTLHGEAVSVPTTLPSTKNSTWVAAGLAVTLAESVTVPVRVAPANGAETEADIEAEDFPALPARVFARGFVMTYARELKLNPEHVWSCFERRWQARGPIPRPRLPGM